MRALIARVVAVGSALSLFACYFLCVLIKSNCLVTGVHIAVCNNSATTPGIQFGETRGRTGSQADPSVYEVLLVCFRAPTTVDLKVNLYISLRGGAQGSGPVNRA